MSSLSVCLTLNNLTIWKVITRLEDFLSIGLLRFAFTLAGGVLSILAACLLNSMIFPLPNSTQFPDLNYVKDIYCLNNKQNKTKPMGWYNGLSQRIPKINYMKATL